MIHDEVQTSSKCDKVIKNRSETRLFLDSFQLLLYLPSKIK